MTVSELPLPGTYRETDSSRIEFAAAMEAWIPLAYDELIATARRYHAVVTYKELSEHVQATSGIRTRNGLQNWIGGLLEEVARRSASAGEPPLTALCVKQDGTIGAGYARAPKSVDGEPGEDIDLYAAGHRLLCYREYAKDLPDDGGVPALTPREAARRSRKTSKKLAEQPLRLCRTCFMELPTSGDCDNCAG